MPRKRTHEEFISELNAISSDIEVLGQYTGRHEPIEVRCLTCGKIWAPSAVDGAGFFC